MFRFFENLVDPYATYPQKDTPPTRLFPFLIDYMRPFRRVFWITGALSVIVAVVEIWLLGYLGRLVNILSEGTPAQVWIQSGTELVLVAIFLLTLRPMTQALHTMLLNQTIMPNIGTIARWRDLYRAVKC